VIFQAPSPEQNVHSQNFVLCPDDTYDRSPCGTGSSARLACLAADGLLSEGHNIVQDSVIGSSYQLSFEQGKNGGIIPTIKGQAFITAESTLVFDALDPFKNGIVF
jgi:4-hydroxyproline epimerase